LLAGGGPGCAGAASSTQRRVQFSWEHGKLTPEEYLEKTSQLEREIASMRPLDY